MSDVHEKVSNLANGKESREGGHYPSASLEVEKGINQEDSNSVVPDYVEGGGAGPWFESDEVEERFTRERLK